MENQPAVADIPSVQIDEGTFKYVLIKITPQNGDDPEKIVVRGYKWAVFHRHIFQEMESKLQEWGLRCTCLGGGRIYHEPNSKKIKVYGLSTKYGQADHELTTRLLNAAYAGYEITWSNDGY